jgi:hypothetical protein
MATTGELRAIIEELKLVDIGDAANYLGEEAIVEEECSIALPISFSQGNALQPLLPSVRFTCQGPAFLSRRE